MVAFEQGSYKRRFRIALGVLWILWLVLLAYEILGNRAGPFSARELAILSISLLALLMATVAMVPVRDSNARLVIALQRRNTQLQTASAVSMAASRILDPQELIEQTVHLIKDQFPFYYVGLFLKDEDGKYAILQAGTGEAGRRMVQEEHRLLVGGQSMIGQCVAHNKPMIALDVDRALIHYANPHLPATRSEMALPLTTPNSGCIGGLTVHSTTANAFSEEDVAALQAMADQIAIAIENARLYHAATTEIQRRIAAEEELKRLNEELEQHVAARTAALVDTNAELEAFTYSVSHDLRAPVRRVRGFVSAVIEDFGETLPEDAVAYLQRAVTATEHMTELIDALLVLSRVSRSELHIAPTNLSQLAQEIVDTLRQSQPERVVDVRIEPNMIVAGDRRLLQIVLENLLSNAWKFTARQSPARITFESIIADGGTAFVVRDNGIGFDMQYADRLFTAFQRLHADSDFGGSGIGLATVQRILHRHGGRVWAEAEPGRGASFYFMLPEQPLTLMSASALQTMTANQ
ncbi:MAG: hypothetical protein Kow0077_12660 [Anaerolineae bacterium]